MLYVWGHWTDCDMSEEFQQTILGKLFCVQKKHTYCV